MNKQTFDPLKKTVISYILLSVLAYFFDKIYALFSHGVTSAWMGNMYLVLLAAGAFVFLLIGMFVPGIIDRKHFRIFINTYHSGIAVFVNGMLLMGILEIAGGTSPFAPWFLYIGCGLILAGVIQLFMILGRNRSLLFPVKE